MRQPTIPPTPTGTSIAGKTAIVTGGNAGIGYESARQFLTLGASRVIIAVRSTSKGQEAVSALRADPTVKKANPSGTVDFFKLDLDDYESAMAFTNKVKAEVPELDILLLNGGVNIMEYETSKSGHERVMQVNAYSNFLIALELMPLLRATSKIRGSPSHLTFVGSGIHMRHTLNKKGVTGSVIGHFDDKKTYLGMFRYGDSKLVVAAFVRAAASRVPASEVIINDPCPGAVATGFDKNLPFWLKPPMFLYRELVARTVEEGAWTMIYATVTANAETHGKFMQSNQVDPGAPYLDQHDGKKFTEKVWEESVAEVQKYDPKFKAW